MQDDRLVINCFEGEQVPNEEELLCEDDIEEVESDEDSSEGEPDVEDEDSDTSDFEDYWA